MLFSLLYERRQAIPLEPFQDTVIVSVDEWRVSLYRTYIGQGPYTWGDAYAHLCREEGRAIDEWSALLESLHLQLAKDVNYIVGKMMETL